MRPFRWVKYSPIFECNLAPLIRANTVLLPKADLDPRAEMGPSVGGNRLFMGLLWLKLCSNGSKRGWIRLRPAVLNWHFAAETDLFNFQCERAINLCLVYTRRPLCLVSFLYFKLSLVWSESSNYSNASGKRLVTCPAIVEMAFYAVNQVINGKIDCHGMVRIRAFCQTQFILGLIRVRERLISMTFFTLKEETNKTTAPRYLRHLKNISRSWFLLNNHSRSTVFPRIIAVLRLIAPFWWKY